MNRVILTGNPNVGKTTIFNSLTKSNEKANNWHGVTVAIKSKKYEFSNQEFLATDLPGIYSLDGYSTEEKIAVEYLKKNKDDLIVNICDANNLKRNLKLMLELQRESFNVLLVVNMVNDFSCFDSTNLSKILGVPVLAVDARKSKDIKSIKTAIFEYFYENKSKNHQNNSKKCVKIDLLNDFCINLKSKSKTNITGKIDKIILNKWLFPPLFLLIIFFVFYLTFGPFGELLTDCINKVATYGFSKITELIFSLNMSNVVKDFLVNAIISSISTVLSFLPQIIILLMIFNLLEDVGIMSRFAFMLDGFMKKIGLTGKSFFSIMMGYGCTTSAVLTTRNLENFNLRKRTALILPFSTCSAKLPIFLTISSIFFDKYKYLCVFALYIFSIFVSIICALIYKKTLKSTGDIFILEMPKYRLPYIKKIVKDTFTIVFDFIIKVGTTIIIFSIIFWLLQNFSLNLKYLNGQNYNQSILFSFSNSIAFLFEPIGLNSPGIISVLIFGLVAKELVVVGLMFVNGATGIEALKHSLVLTNSMCHFSLESATIFLVFLLLYSPCISALASIKAEFGRKFAVFVFVIQFIISYVVCLILKLFFESVFILKICLFLFSIAFLLRVVIKYCWIKKCGGNCYACRKF